MVKKMTEREPTTTDTDEMEQQDRLVERHKMGHWFSQRHIENIREGCSSESATDCDSENGE